MSEQSEQSNGLPLQAFTRYFCDVCGEPIEAAERAYVVWRSAERHYFDFKIIHQGQCDPKGPYHASQPLTDFLGTNGLARLTTLLSAGPIQTNLGRSKCQRVPDEHMDQFVDFFRRAQLPFYEEARRHFDDPGVLEQFSDASESRAYLKDALKDIASTSTQD